MNVITKGALIEIFLSAYQSLVYRLTFQTLRQGLSLWSRGTRWKEQTTESRIIFEVSNHNNNKKNLDVISINKMQVSAG